MTATRALPETASAFTAILLALFLIAPVTIAQAPVGTTVIAAIVRGVIGLRVSSDIERPGIDINQHGEEGYIASVEED